MCGSKECGELVIDNDEDYDDDDNNNNKLWEELIAYVPFIRYGMHKHGGQDKGSIMMMMIMIMTIIIIIIIWGVLHVRKIC
jgi:uncharacterized membrane protein